MQDKYIRPTVSILSAAAAAPFPPTSWAYVDAKWNGQDRIPEAFELQIWSNGADNLTNATLYGGVPHPLTFATSAAITANTIGNLFTLTAHGYQTGDGPVQFSDAGGTLPSGMALATNYWIILVSANTFQIATSLANAMTGSALTITTNGTGTITLTGAAGSARVYWHDKALLNPTGAAVAGSITLTASQAFAARFTHDTTTIAYAISATLSAGNVSAQVAPISLVG